MSGDSFCSLADLLEYRGLFYTAPSRSRLCIAGAGFKGADSTRCYPKPNVPSLSVVIPIHNEEPSILQLYDRLTAVMERLRKPYEIIFVDDAYRCELRPPRELSRD